MRCPLKVFNLVVSVEERWTINHGEVVWVGEEEAEAEDGEGEEREDGEKLEEPEGEVEEELNQRFRRKKPA
jgi:hypothetical protein